MAMASVPCPMCGSQMYDNRFDKKNPRGPDLKCKADGDHAFWLPRDAKKYPALAQLIVGQQQDTPAVQMAKQVEAEERAELAKVTTPKANGNGGMTAEQAVMEYNEVLDYVLALTVPRLIKAEIGASPESINATVATIMIHRQRASR